MKMTEYEFQFSVIRRQPDGSFRESVKAKPELSFPRDRNYVARSLMRLRGMRHMQGQLGKHLWCLEKVKDSYWVFVDGRKVAESATKEDGKTISMRMIGRIVADGDYLLGEKPFGFEPPMISG